MIFNVDIDKWVEQNLPWLLRQPRMLAFLKVCVSPIVKIYNDFLTRRNDNVLKATYTGQVWSLTKILNDKYDPIERRITIDDGFSTQRKYVFLKQEEKPVYLNPTMYVFAAGEYADSGIDFIVNTHNAFVITAAIKNEIRITVNYFKLASKRYSIQ